MKRVDQGYEANAKAVGVVSETFTFEETQSMQRAVWDQFGCVAFSAPSGNMVAVLCNLAAQKAVNNGVYLDKLATLEAELSGLRARYLRMESEDAATIAQQAEQLAAAESRLHDVATHCATVEQQLAAAEKDAERYRWLRSNHPIHDNSPFICRNFGAAFSQWTDDQADKAIDAAIAASREGKS